MSNIYIDGFTRVGKDFYANELSTQLNKVIIPSVHDFDDSIESTDLEFFTFSILVNRLHLLTNIDNKIVVRSPYGDLSYYSLIHILDKAKNSKDELEFNKTMNNYIALLSRALAKSELFNESNDRIILITKNIYDDDKYIENLSTKKSMYHYYGLIKRFDLINDEFKNKSFIDKAIMIRDLYNHIYLNLFKNLPIEVFTGE